MLLVCCCGSAAGAPWCANFCCTSCKNPIPTPVASRPRPLRPRWACWRRGRRRDSARRAALGRLLPGRASPPQQKQWSVIAARDHQLCRDKQTQDGRVDKGPMMPRKCLSALAAPRGGGGMAGGGVPHTWRPAPSPSRNKAFLVICRRKSGVINLKQILWCARPALDKGMEVHLAENLT